jgi:hypothetical protein
MIENARIITIPETVNEDGDVVPAQELHMPRASWKANTLSLEEDHPQFVQRQLGAVATSEDLPAPQVAPSAVPTSAKKPGYKTAAQRNARAHERQARKDRWGK